MSSLDPLLCDDGLLSMPGEGRLEKSGGSDLRVINTFPGKLRPLSNLDYNKKHCNIKWAD